jgi:hypothetical protein
MVLLLHCSPCRATRWQDCGRKFRAALEYDANGNVSRYVHTQRPTRLLPGHPAPLMVTFDGCLAFCGGGPQTYPSDDITESLSTWILPLLGGLLLQVPFESGGAVGGMLLQVARWLGNPAAILMYTLRNMRDTGRAARLLLLLRRRPDRSVPDDCVLGYRDDADGGGDSSGDGDGGKCGAHRHPTANGTFGEYDDAVITIDYHDPRAGPPDKTNAFSDLRDGLYILTVLNQYELEAAGTRDGDLADARASVDDMYAVLLFALFSRGAAANTDERWHDNCPRNTSGHHQDAGPVSSSSSKLLCRRRAALAEHLRATRKHSAVPVLASVLWFGVAMAISVSKAFRNGQRQRVQPGAGPARELAAAARRVRRRRPQPDEQPARAPGAAAVSGLRHDGGPRGGLLLFGGSGGGLCGCCCCS